MAAALLVSVGEAAREPISTPASPEAPACMVAAEGAEDLRKEAQEGTAARAAAMLRVLLAVEVPEARLEIQGQQAPTRRLRELAARAVVVRVKDSSEALAASLEVAVEAEAILLVAPADVEKSAWSATSDAGESEDCDMIISHKHKFIYVKNRRVAGTSTEIFLSQVCGPDDVVTPCSLRPEPGHEPRNYKGVYHAYTRADAARALVGEEIWGSYFKFCVERNPWEKTISYFEFIRQVDSNWKSQKVPPTLQDFLDHAMKVVDDPPGMPEAIRAVPRVYRKLPRDFQRYTDAAGNLIVDKVCRYETLAADLAAVFQQLGIPFDPAAGDGGLGVRAKSEYRTDRRPCCDVYTPEQAAVIEKVFEKEIAMFGYTLG
jgi:hypothetical protein